MKIASQPTFVAFNSRVDKDTDGHAQPHYQKDAPADQKKGEEKQEEQKKLSYSQEINEIITNEVEKFKDDPAALSHGLNAQVQGAGPGLRVTLRDGYGAVVRQFTGEEFLKLRETAVQGVGRGKILDKKL